MSEERDSAEGDTPSDIFDASDPAQVRARKRRVAINAANKTKFLGRLLGDEIGRALLWEILELSQWMGPKYGPTQAISDNQAGQREHAFQIMRTCIRHQPFLTAQMIAENDHG
jgi:hypothetical protein